MRYLQLIKTEITNPRVRENTIKAAEVKGEDPAKALAFSYKTILQWLLDTDAQGVTLATMRTAIKILDKLNEQPENGLLELEDAEFEFLKGKVAQLRAPFADRAYLDFEAAINNASEETPPHLKGDTKKLKAVTA